MKIRIQCIGILQAIDGPFAVLVADVRLPKGIKGRYVLLPETCRAQISRMTNYNRDYNRPATIDWPRALPALIRTHAFDVEGKLLDDEPLTQRAGRWGNAESLWVSTDVGLTIIGDFKAWRNENPALPNERIWAPSWGALTAVQALCLATDMHAPHPNDRPQEESIHG